MAYTFVALRARHQIKNSEERWLFSKAVKARFEFHYYLKAARREAALRTSGSGRSAD